MNYNKAISTIGNILRDNDKDNVCIFIDGEWGIGKTYTINKFIDNSNISLKYVSVFGKKDLKDIEKDIVMQLFLNKKNSKLNKFKNNRGTKIIGNAVSDTLKHFMGIDTNLIRNISIENMPSDNETVVCIDDLERKSENINLNDILGLVERASIKFNIILIGSSSHFTDEQFKDFNRFKEKVIDYEITIDELGNETLKEILKDKFGDVENEIENLIVENFKKHFNKLNNLRVYKKYVQLLYRVSSELKRILSTNDNKLDEKIITLSSKVVIEDCINFDSKGEKNNNLMDYRSQQLKNAIERISKYEEYEENILREYCEIFSEIQDDINNLYNLHKLTREKAIEITNRIKDNIKLENVGYFLKQKYIVQLYDVFCDIGIINQFRDGLIEMAEKLYEPIINEEPPQFNIDDYNTYNPAEGERQNYNVVDIIQYINRYNRESYDALKSKTLNDCIENRDIGGIKEMLKYHKSIKFEQFKDIYDIATSELHYGYNENIWRLLVCIINKADSEEVKEFFNQEKENKKQGIDNTIISNVRLQRLIDILDEKMYFEWEMKCRMKSYEEIQDSN